jgi:hypothetical protein
MAEAFLTRRGSLNASLDLLECKSEAIYLGILTDNDVTFSIPSNININNISGYMITCAHSDQDYKVALYSGEGKLVTCTRFSYDPSRNPAVSFSYNAFSNSLLLDKTNRQASFTTLTSGCRCTVTFMYSD